VFEEEIDHGGGVEGENLGEQQAADDGDAERLCVSPFIPPSNAKDAVTRLKRSAAMM